MEQTSDVFFFLWKMYLDREENKGFSFLNSQHVVKSKIH